MKSAAATLTAVDLEQGGGAGHGFDRHLEGLEITVVAGRLEAELAVAGRQPLFRSLEAGGADAAPLPLVGRQPADVGADAGGIGRRRRRGGRDRRGQQEEKRKGEGPAQDSSHRILDRKRRGDAALAFR